MKIGIMAAMKQEMQALSERQSEFSRRGFVLKVSGVGKVNAALATAELINVDHVDAIVMIGTCGALLPGIPKGRVAMIKEAMYHDVDAGGLGFPPGQIPFHPSALWRADDEIDGALALALGTARQVAWRRRIISGDRFISSKEEATRIGNLFEAALVDMETAAVGHACEMLGIPWGALRIVSDSADENAGGSFGAFVRDSSYQLAEIMQYFRLPERQRSSPQAASRHEGAAHTVRQFSGAEPQNDTRQGKRGG